MRPRFASGLKLLVSAACLASVWAWIEPADLAARLRSIRWIPFLAAALLNLLCPVLNALKLRALFPPPGPSLPGLLRANFVSIFFGAFVPGGAGGEVARWAWLRREAGAARALSAILLDRLTGLWAQIVLVLAAWIASGRGHRSLASALAISGAVLAASLWAGAFGYRRGARWGVRVSVRAGAWLARRRGTRPLPGGSPETRPEDVGEALAELLSGRARVFRVAVLSAANQALVLALFLLADRAAGGATTWEKGALLLFGYTVAALIPVSFGNLGFTEGAMGFLYRAAGAARETGVALSLALRVLNVPALALGWGLFLAGRGRRSA